MTATETRTIGASRSTIALVIVGLVVAVGLVFLVAPRASSDPDGLERVAEDEGFAEAARDHDLADAPLADYGVADSDDAIATGVSGLIGVAITFGIGVALFGALRWWRRAHPTEGVRHLPSHPAGD